MATDSRAKRSGPSRLCRSALALALVAGALTTHSGSAGATNPEPFEVVADGLDNPRGITAGPGGRLFVAEAGRGGGGPCVTGPQGAPLCIGSTGSVAAVNPDSGRVRRVLEGLPSIAQRNGLEAAGVSDVVLQRNGRLLVTVGLGLDPGRRSEFGPEGSGLAQLYRGSRGGRARPVADIGAAEAALNPDRGAIDDTNGTSIVADGRATVVADAGANALFRVAADGSVATLAVFPSRPVPAPASLNLPTGTQIPMQAVPTSVTIGPDGAYYVGQLTGFPFPVGGARVYRVPREGGEPQVFADGFTTVTDLAFGPDGSLYVVQISRSGLQSPDRTGAVIRVAPDGSREILASEGLTRPYGVTVDPDGAVYVTNCGDCVEPGQVVRISTDTGRTPGSRRTADLDGLQEVTADGTPGAGDLDGRGSASFTISPERGSLCYEVAVADIAAPTRFHIHRGDRGVNGAIVVPFFESAQPPAPEGCVLVDRALADDIVAHPERYYANVHNADFPAGAVRGQLADPHAGA